MILRGQWGLQVDKAIVWTTGWSLVTAQYAWAAGDTYVPTLMLWTTGAKSGRIRSACLPYFRVGDDLVIRGSNGGGATDPHWVHNVRAHPQAWIRVNRRNRPVHAHVAQRRGARADLRRAGAAEPIDGALPKMCAPRELPLVVLRATSGARRSQRSSSDSCCEQQARALGSGK